MSKRNFGAIKSLLHFDYPYFNEPGDGLGDEVGLETWSKENSNVALCGSAITNTGTRAPKFGYRCLKPYNGAVLGTNNTGIWNMNSSGEYEIEFFVFMYGFMGGKIYFLRLYSSENNELLSVLSNTSGCIEVRCPEWGISDAITSSAALTTKEWKHILLRISNSTLKMFIDGVETLSQELTPNVTLTVDKVYLGRGSTSYGYSMDEFVFRHAVGSGAPTVPTEPYSGVLDISEVGGVGTGADGYVTISADTQINSYGQIKAITGTKSFTVSSWSNGSITPAVGCEVMLHITGTGPQISTVADYPFVGLYAFAKIAELDDTSIVLDRAISTEYGCDLTLDSSILENYEVSVIVIPNFNCLTIDTGVTVSPAYRNGIVVFRCKKDCIINGSIYTLYRGLKRYDLHQMTHSKLIDRFLCSHGGGIFIACGGTFTDPLTARLGADWSGLGENGNGAAGYGGKGGDVKPSSIKTFSGGAGGVGGGGGGQGGSGGFGGSGKYVKGCDAKGVNSGGVDISFVNVFSGVVGGGPGGNGGNGIASTTSGSRKNVLFGIAGANIILICNKLKADEAALSTGGAAGETRAYESGYARIGGAGGGGTGFCYIACNERVSA